MRPVERFDPEGLKDLKGSGGGMRHDSDGDWRGQRVQGDEFARFVSKPNRAKELRIERVREKSSAWKRRGRAGALTS
jgi:hypothetical protein